MMDHSNAHRFSVAPMMAVTDRYFRYLFRQLSRRSKLYTEMYVDKTLLHQQDNLHNFLSHRAAEGPLAVQLGGNDPDTLAEAAEMCEQWAFSEINLNCGCPSSKVSDRCFGARLMLDPERVREITYGMIRKVTRTPVTVKCRIGVDDKDSYDELTTFVRAVKAAGVDHVVVHARKCLLKGLSTSANRTIPPLRYDVVHRLAQEFPELEIVLNGGIDSLGAVNEHIAGTGEWGGYGGGVAGVMVGRAAYFDPWTFRHTDSAVFGSSDPGFTRREIMERCVDRFTEMMQEGRREGPECNRTRHLCLGTVTKPLGYLSSGARGSRTFRQELSRAVQAQSKIDPDTDDFRDAVDRAMALLPEGVLDEPVGDTPECAFGSHVRDD
ncbi:unnamed protein product [Ectocarpus sp. 6 AP-2014]